MTEPEQLPAQERFYGSLASMLRKYDRYARQDAFRGSTPEEFRQWREDTRSLLHSLLGTCKMERGIQDARRMETVFTEEGIRREHREKYSQGPRCRAASAITGDSTVAIATEHTVPMKEAVMPMPSALLACPFWVMG